MDALCGAGIEAVATREPGGAPGAEQIRALLVTGAADRWDPLAETLLHFAARQEHLRVTIRPALARGAWVVCDRFADSTLAYQGYGQGVSLDALARLRHLVVGATEPDLTIILDVPVELGLARAAARSGTETRYETMGIELHRRIRAGFLDIARSDPQRCVLLDGTAEPARVQEAVRAAVRERLGAGL